MFSKHKSSGTVKAYLLGMLNDSDAAAVEERYFTDRYFFLFVQRIETSLIEDYLAGRLRPVAKSRFESRYLDVPELCRRVEEIRKTGIAARPRFSTIRIALAAALLLLAVGALFWMYRGSSRVPPIPGLNSPPVLATISLGPGLVKGAPEERQLNLANASGNVRLLLDLPGQRNPLRCSVHISLALPSGVWTEAWHTAQPVSSVPSPGGQTLTLTVDASVLSAGDYRAEIVGTDRQVIESYYFRVSRL